MILKHLKLLARLMLGSTFILGIAGIITEHTTGDPNSLLVVISALALMVALPTTLVVYVTFIVLFWRWILTSRDTLI